MGAKTLPSKKDLKGLFIAFEGIEGSGKSTQAQILSQKLISIGKEVIQTYEPGGTELGKTIRQILLAKDIEKIDPWAELFLFCAARRQLIQDVIVPALKASKIVVCDRYAYSTLAYQGSARGLNQDLLQEIVKISTAGLLPNLTFLLDLEVTEGLNRKLPPPLLPLSEDQDRFHSESLSFHQKVRQGYLEIAKNNPDSIYIINANRDIAEIQEQIWQIVTRFI